MCTANLADELRRLLIASCKDMEGADDERTSSNIEEVVVGFAPILTTMEQTTDIAESLARLIMPDSRIGGDYGKYGDHHAPYAPPIPFLRFRNWRQLLADLSR